ncbi:nuclear transport factor 2 family protein [Leucothrix sargassi]|nr:nuclear transport factor 2 family protein [Leucothrix sargassi]
MTQTQTQHFPKGDIIEQFAALYQTLNKENLHRLSEVYDDDVVFIDSAHELKGIQALTYYFDGLYTNLDECTFDIEHIQSDGEGRAFITWTLHFVHPKLAGGKKISVAGASDLKFDEKITYHRDYVDMGQMIYEHLPVVGSVIRMIKKRVTS